MTTPEGVKGAQEKGLTLCLVCGIELVIAIVLVVKEKNHRRGARIVVALHWDPGLRGLTLEILPVGMPGSLSLRLVRRSSDCILDVAGLRENL